MTGGNALSYDLSTCLWTVVIRTSSISNAATALICARSGAKQCARSSELDTFTVCCSFLPQQLYTCKTAEQQSIKLDFFILHFTRAWKPGQAAYHRWLPHDVPYTKQKTFYCTYASRTSHATGIRYHFAEENTSTKNTNKFNGSNNNHRLRSFYMSQKGSNPQLNLQDTSEEGHSPTRLQLLMLQSSCVQLNRRTQRPLRQERLVSRIPRVIHTDIQRLAHFT